MKMPMNGQTFQFFPDLDSSDLSTKVFGYFFPRIKTVSLRCKLFASGRARLEAFEAKIAPLVSHSFDCVSLYIARQNAAIDATLGVREGVSSLCSRLVANALALIKTWGGPTRLGVFDFFD